MTQGGYHHGDLRRALLDAAKDAIVEAGPAALSLRDLARRAGVSHAAPAHHFGDKAGLLTALATDGYQRLAGELSAARAATGSFLEIGVAYVRFAITHRAHFEVMFRPDLHHRDDTDLLAARSRAGDALYGGVAELSDGPYAPGAGPADVRHSGLAAWSMAHGFATLWLTGAIPADGLPADPDAAARQILRHLTPPRPADHGVAAP